MFSEELVEPAKLVVAVLTVTIAIASFIIARRADSRSKKAEEVKSLLGEKESVAFAALKLLREQLPANERDRRLLLAALLQACVFEGSDRARALLYRVIELNRGQFREELRTALHAINDTFASMDEYKFTKEELDLERGRRRIAAVEKVVNAK
jgi:hypothetical protein